MLYLGYALGLFGALSATSLRSVMSKLVSLDEVGKVMALCGLVMVRKQSSPFSLLKAIQF